MSSSPEPTRFSTNKQQQPFSSYSPTRVSASTAASISEPPPLNSQTNNTTNNENANVSSSSSSQQQNNNNNVVASPPMRFTIGKFLNQMESRRQQQSPEQHHQPTTFSPQVDTKSSVSSSKSPSYSSSSYSSTAPKQQQEEKRFSSSSNSPSNYRPTTEKFLSQIQSPEEQKQTQTQRDEQQESEQERNEQEKRRPFKTSPTQQPPQKISSPPFAFSSQQQQQTQNRQYQQQQPNMVTEIVHGAVSAGTSVATNAIHHAANFVERALTPSGGQRTNSPVVRGLVKVGEQMATNAVKELGNYAQRALTPPTNKGGGRSHNRNDSFGNRSNDSTGQRIKNYNNNTYSGREGGGLRKTGSMISNPDYYQQQQQQQQQNNFERKRTTSSPPEYQQQQQEQGKREEKEKEGGGGIFDLIKSKIKTTITDLLPKSQSKNAAITSSSTSLSGTFSNKKKTGKGRLTKKELRQMEIEEELEKEKKEEEENARNNNKKNTHSMWGKMWEIKNILSDNNGPAPEKSKRWIEQRAESLRLLVFGLLVLLSICIACVGRDTWMTCGLRTMTRALRGNIIGDATPLIDDNDILANQIGTHVYVAATAGIWKSCVTARINRTQEGKLLEHFEKNLRNALRTVREGPSRSEKAAILTRETRGDWYMPGSETILTATGFTDALPVFQVCNGNIRDHSKCNAAVPDTTFTRFRVMTTLMLVVCGLLFFGICVDLTPGWSIQIHKTVMSVGLIFIWSMSLAVWVVYLNSANVPSYSGSTHAECELETNLREVLASFAYATIYVAENATKYQAMLDVVNASGRNASLYSSWNSTELATLQQMQGNLSVVPSHVLQNRVMYFDDCNVGFSLFGWISSWIVFSIVVLFYVISRFTAYVNWNCPSDDDIVVDDGGKEEFDEARAAAKTQKWNPTSHVRDFLSAITGQNLEVNGGDEDDDLSSSSPFGTTQSSFSFSTSFAGENVLDDSQEEEEGDFSGQDENLDQEINNTSRTFKHQKGGGKRKASVPSPLMKQETGVYKPRNNNNNNNNDDEDLEEGDFDEEEEEDDEERGFDDYVLDYLAKFLVPHLVGIEKKKRKREAQRLFAQYAPKSLQPFSAAIVDQLVDLASQQVVERYVEAK